MKNCISIQNLILILCLLFCIDAQSQALYIGTYCGTATQGYNGDGGAAIEAQLNFPQGVAVDATGNVYIADGANARIRKVMPDGFISTIAGDGTFAQTGDGGLAVNAQLGAPIRVSVDGFGNIYIIDNNIIRKIDTSGIITKVAGTGPQGYSGDGGDANLAALNTPNAVAFDAAGNFYIADQFNYRIRKVNVSTGIITTVAGNGAPGFTGDGGLAVNASLKEPQGVAVDAAGNIYIADRLNNRIRKVNTSGIISTYAGNGGGGYGGDGGAAISAFLNEPAYVVTDASGNLYISDMNNSRIRKVTTSGIISTVAGNGTYGFNGDGGLASNAQLGQNYAIAVDAAGQNIYTADVFKIRKIGPLVPPAITTCPSGINAMVNANGCQSVVDYLFVATGHPTPAMLYYFSGATTGSGTGTGSGSAFNPGTTLVNIVLDNGLTPTLSCSFGVFVTNDPVGNPVITASGNTELCPSDSLVLTANSPGGSIHMDGIDDNVYLPVIPSMNSFTIEFSFKLDQSYDAARQDAMMLYQSEGLNTAGTYIFFDNNIHPGAHLILFRNYPSSVDLISSNTSWLADQWYHVAVTYNAISGDKRLYINGVLDTSYTEIGGYYDSPVEAHTFGDYNQSGFTNFGGELDEFRIWNVARSSVDVANNFEQEVDINSAGLVLYFKANEGSGGMVYDWTTNNYDGSLGNGASWSFESPVSYPYQSYLWSNGATTQSTTIYSSGTYGVTVYNQYGCIGQDTIVITNGTALNPVINSSGPVSFCDGGNVVLSTNYLPSSNALSFDGVNDCIEIPASPLLALGDFTMEYWLNIPTLSSAFNRITATQGYEFETTVSNNIFHIHGLGYGWTPVTSITNNTWMHFAIVRSGNNLKIYKDGILVFNQIRSTTLTETKWFIGKAYTNTEFAEMKLDEFRLWNVARTQSEIISTMNSTVIQNTSGLALYYRMDETSGITVADFSGNTINGTLTNGPQFLIPSTSPVNQGVDYTYLWSNGATTHEIFVDSSGSYNVTVTGNGGCSGTSAFETITVFPNPVVEINSNIITESCADENAVLSVNTDSTFTSWQWSTGDTTATILATQSGSYQVTITNTNGCSSISDTELVNLNVAFIPAPGISVSFPGPCDTANVNLTYNNGNALRFNGNQKVNLGSWFNYQNFTIEMWLKPGAIQNEFADIMEVDHSASGGWVIEQLSTTNNTYYIYMSGVYSGVFNMAPDTWTHLAVVKSSTQLIVYLNGVIVSSVPLPPGFLIDYSLPEFTLGGWVNSDRGWTGEMDEVRMYNVALIQSDIQARMNYTIGDNSNNLVAYYRLNEVADSIIYDATVNNYDGNLVITPGEFLQSTAPLNLNINSVLWSTGNTMGTITVPFGGYYSVTATNTSGCTGSSLLTEAVVTNVPKWYLDADNDGYAGSDVFVYQYCQPNGYYPNSTDCNDGDSLSYPGAIITYACTESVTASNNYCTDTTIVPAPIALNENCIGNGVLSFDGPDDGAIIYNNSVLSGTFTVECWARPMHPTNYSVIMGSRWPVDFGFDMKFGNGNIIHGDIGNGSTWLTTSADAPLNYVVGAWYHIAYVVTPSGYSIYIDGILSGSGAFNGTPLLYGFGRNLSLGALGANTPFNSEPMIGDLDEVRIWNIARTQAEINYNMNKKLTGLESGLLHYYDLNDNAGSAIAVDRGSAGENATLVNMDINNAWKEGNEQIPLYGVINDFNNSANGADVYPLGLTYVNWVISSKDTTINCITEVLVSALNPCFPALQVKFFIEGYYLGNGLMQPVLYNAGVSLNQTECDSVILELHDPVSNQILVSNTVILSTDGFASVSLPSYLMGGNYYVVIRNRTGVETWSKLPVLIGINNNIDFTE